MEKKIITISREFGSGGRTSGRRVAEELGIPFYDKELVDQIALESGFAPKFVEENGEHSPGLSRLSAASSCSWLTRAPVSSWAGMPITS